MVCAAMTANENSFQGAPMSNPPEGSQFFNEHPPTTYVIDISPGVTMPVEFGTDCAAFYGAGGRQAPAMLHTPLVLPQASIPAANSVGCELSAKQPVAPLAAGQSVTFSFLWAYDMVGTGADLQSYIDEYAPLVAADTLVSTTVSSWLNVSFQFNGSGVEDWATRETLWNSYMLLSGASVDDAFGERMLDQGTGYRYFFGFQGAPRDPAQHLLPAIYSSPWLSKSVLRYLVKMVQSPSVQVGNESIIGGPQFNLPYMAVNAYQLGYVEVRPSDQEMYILNAAAEYLLATRDMAFLDEPVLLYGDLHRSNASQVYNTTIGDALLRCLDFSLHNVSTGPHQLMRSLTSDWSDMLCLGLQPGCTGPNSSVWQAFVADGESVLNAAMATFVMPRFADALEAANPSKYASAIADARAFAAGQVTALAGSGWNHNSTWLRRAYLSNTTGWLGDTELVGVQHSWALLSEAVDLNQSLTILSSIDQVLRQPTSLGMPLLSPPLPLPDYAAGTGENGAIWQSLNMPLVWAFGKYNLSMAWDEWSKNSLRAFTNTYPDYWAGIWSSSDSINSYQAAEGLPGRNGNWVSSWPTQCTHRHGWPLFALLKLTGISFDGSGLRLSPGYAVDLQDRDDRNDAQRLKAGDSAADEGWSFSTPRVSIQRSGATSWSGHWDLLPVSDPWPLKPVGGEPASPSVDACASVATMNVSIDADLPVPADVQSCTLKAWCGSSGAAAVDVAATLRPLTARERIRHNVDIGAADRATGAAEAASSIHLRMATASLSSSAMSAALASCGNAATGCARMLRWSLTCE